uniref:Uncharacterized protein n=1 Tax=Oryza nivara TaxID=4536 RepID=A0A0E0J2M7_ORYNI
MEGIPGWASQNLKQPDEGTISHNGRMRRGGERQAPREVDDGDGRAAWPTATTCAVADDDGCAGWPMTSIARSPSLRRGVVAVAVEGRRRRSGGGVGLAGSGLGQRRRRLAGEVSARSPSSRSPLSLQPSPSPTPDSAAPCCLTGRLADNSALDSDTPGTPAQRRLVGRLADNWLALLFKAVELLLAVAMASGGADRRAGGAVGERRG